MTRPSGTSASPSCSVTLPDPEATEAVGAALWRAWTGGHHVVALEGDLGAGKTTLVRGLLRAAGHGGAVRSPTYTLMEPYDVAGRRVLHLDLYRLGDPGELDFLGLRDELSEGVLVLVEWPERGAGFMPPADLEIHLADDGDGRVATIHGHGDAAAAVVRAVLSDASND